MFNKKNKGSSPAQENAENNQVIQKSEESVSDEGSSFLTRVYGLIFVCLGVIGFLNSDFLGIGSFICYIFVYAFGIFSYFALGGIILLGLFLLVKGKWPKFRVTFSGLGWVFLFLFGTLASSLAIDNLTIPTFLEIHNANMEAISVSSFQITGINYIPSTYGGFLGNLFAALLITGTGMIGAMIFSYLFLIVGIVLILRAPFYAFYLWLKDQNTKRISKNEQKKIQKEKEKRENLEKKETAHVKKVSPFEETKYEGEPSKPEKKNIKKDENDQEKDVFSAKTSTLSPMMSEYSSSKNRNFDRVSTKDSSSVESLGDLSTKRKATDVFNDKKILDSQTSGNFESELAKKSEDDRFVKSPDSNFSSTADRREQPPLEGKEEFNIFGDRIEKYEDETPIKEEKSMEEDDRDYFSKMKVNRGSDPTSLRKTLDEKDYYTLPYEGLLSTYSNERKDSINEENARVKIGIIDNVFKKFNIGAHVVSYTIGPTVTRFNVKRDNGVKLSVFSSYNIQQEISSALNGDMSVRVEEVVKGQSTSGIEVANEAPTLVSFKECLEQVNKYDDKLLIPLGEDISSQVVCTSLDKLPHLLVAGTTGSGKSVFIHSIIMTLIMRNYPEELKFILIDPKRVEFNRYKDMPHLYCPIISNVNRAVATLKKLIAEMERRYTILSRCEVSKIQEYNKMKSFNPEWENMPYLVCVIDEFADLMGQDAKNVDNLTQRLTQKARAAGIYLIIATQRPSVKCITGTIKANIPSRIALSLPTYTDSRTILDEGGAEVLIGRGDLLARIPNSFKSTVRLQSAFVSPEEMSSVVNYLRSQIKPVYNPEFLNIETQQNLGTFSRDRHLSGYEDELYGEIKRYVMESNTASTSDLQRRYSIGYGRAAAIFDALEDEGIVITVKPSNRKQVVKHIDSDRGI